MPRRPEIIFRDPITTSTAALMRQLVLALRAGVREAWAAKQTAVVVGGYVELTALRDLIEGQLADAVSGPATFLWEYQDRERKKARPAEAARRAAVDGDEEDRVETARRDARRRMRR